MRISRVLALVGMVALITGCPVTPGTNDPCANVTCGADETCVEGQCVEQEDPCANVTCDTGQTCVDGECIDDPCADVTCDTGQSCVNGQCGTGDAASGQTTFDSNCMVCHGADASGVVGPNIQGAPVLLIQEHVIEGHEGHTMFELSDQDLLDVEAYLATLVP